MQGGADLPSPSPFLRFGIGTFYTILDQLFKQLFSTSQLLSTVSGTTGPPCLHGPACLHAAWLCAARIYPCCSRPPVTPAHTCCCCAPASPLLLQIGQILTMIYLFLIIVQVVINLKNKPEAVEKVHLFCTVYFMLYMVAFTGITIW